MLRIDTIGNYDVRRRQVGFGRVDCVQLGGRNRVAVGQGKPSPPFLNFGTTAEQVIVDGCRDSATVDGPHHRVVVDTQVPGGLVNGMRIQQIEHILAPENVAEVDPPQEDGFEEAVLIADHVLHVQLRQLVPTGIPGNVFRDVVKSPGRLVRTDKNMQRLIVVSRLSVIPDSVELHLFSPNPPSPSCRRQPDPRLDDRGDPHFRKGKVQ